MLYLIAQQIFSGWIEIEQRIWMRLQWTRQFARLDSCGLLQISTPALFDKQLFPLIGAQVVLIDKQAKCAGAIKSHLTLLIKLDRSRQYGDESEVVFRLCSTDEEASWIAALSRSHLPFISNYLFLSSF